MSFSTKCTAAFLVAQIAATMASYGNCDPSHSTNRDDVLITDEAFEILDIDVSNEWTFDLDILYYPEQVIAKDYRSSVFMYLKDNTGGLSGSGKCASEFDFGTGGNGAHSSLMEDFNRSCITLTSTPGVWPKSYEGDIAYWHCLGDTSDCDDVTAAAVGFDADDMTSYNTLRAEYLCTLNEYSFELEVSDGGLDADAQFVMEYIRDPIEPPEAPFYGANGAVQELQNQLDWAICDINEDGDTDWAACFARASQNPPPRVLDLSLPTEDNDFSAVFRLVGVTDRSLVSSTEPLTINNLDSTHYLYHADYALSTYDDCTTSCSDVTTEQQQLETMSLLSADTPVSNNYDCAITGPMPVFDSTVSTAACDVNFCTYVMNLNFESAAGSRRALFVPTSLERKRYTNKRRLGESAKQSRATKARVPRDAGEANNWMLVLVAGCVGFVLVGALIWKRRSQEEEEEQPRKTISTKSSDLSASSEECV